jgi:hypothetical protein
MGTTLPVTDEKFVHLQMMREENLPLPQSQTEAEYMDIPLSA